ncbi:hypothetical protein DPMN_064355 [Dreissena polymorpha]|uniref:Uncharacterized protein n=1 Tax=Dreissena polymorpha TaxID=45954 RepID=A0A9D4HM25_DREPO|nr:hypothetical protein DPMN_064355 [Dreissena polymorpha]
MHSDSLWNGCCIDYRAQEIYHQEQQQYDRDGRGMIAQLYHASPDPHSLGHSSPIHSGVNIDRDRSGERGKIDAILEGF